MPENLFQNLEHFSTVAPLAENGSRGKYLLLCPILIPKFSLSKNYHKTSFFSIIFQVWYRFCFILNQEVLL